MASPAVPIFLAAGGSCAKTSERTWDMGNRMAQGHR